MHARRREARRSRLTTTDDDPTSSTAASSSASTTSLLAALREDGVVHVPGVLSASELAACRTAASHAFGEVLRTMLLQQVLRRDETPARFTECVERDGGRLDVRHSLCARDDAVGTALRAAGSRSALLPLLSAALGDDAAVTAAGNVVAMSTEGWLETVADDAEDATEVLADSLGPQAWHADGPHLFDGVGTLPVHALNVFFPLVDLTEENGPTEFVVGSHLHGRGGAPDESPEGLRTRRTILARAGDAVVFDYRTWHRGSANRSGLDRHVLYAVVGRPWWLDSRNYGQSASLSGGGGGGGGASADGGRAARVPIASLVAGQVAEEVEGGAPAAGRPPERSGRCLRKRSRG